MFSFAYKYLLLLLLLVPVLVTLYFWARYARKRKLYKFGHSAAVRTLMPQASPYKPPLKMTVAMLALTALILGAARPWGGLQDEKSVKEGIEVIIAVDASNSMLAPASAEGEGVSRMRQGKLMLEKLINRLDNDRVGLIVFAGNAYTLIPVTSDYVSAKMFLNSIDPSQISNQGTNIGAAIDLAERSFSENKKVGKALVVITDAEELDDEDGVMKAAENCGKRGIQLDVIGVGSSAAVKVPTGRDEYLIDPTTGAPVQTALNEDLAAKIAGSGKGIYVNAANNDALNELSKQLDTVKKTALETSFSALHVELFPIFLWIAFALIIINVVIMERKNSWLAKITFFKKEDNK